VIELGVAGCGDVAFRTYFPVIPLLERQGLARVAAVFDPVGERAERAAALFAGARAYSTLDGLLGHPGLDGLVNLTPAPAHRDVNAAALETGLHVYSEKPLAGSVEAAQELIALAERRERLLLAAPGIMVSNRFVWLKRLLGEGRLGRPTLATAQMVNLGPAAWRGYTVDPAVFYGPEVGPLLDTGVYVLHAITGLLGPARRVQAFGGVAIPERPVLIPGRDGQTVRVTANDLMLLHLDFGRAFAQILSSFATPGSRAPVLEVHGTRGSLSIASGAWYDANGPTDFYLRDESALGLEGWTTAWPPEASPHGNLIGSGVPHFVACIRGEEAPILTAAHGTHVLEIILKATEAAASGQTLALETTF
jgi:predicted dehydrogenase